MDDVLCFFLWLISSLESGVYAISDETLNL